MTKPSQTKQRNNRQTRTRPSEFRAREADDGKKTIEGHFVLFDTPTELFPGCFETISADALDASMENDVRALINHDSTLVLGRKKAGTLEISKDEKGLLGRIVINEHDQDALNLYARVQRGDVNQCSFGFDIREEISDFDEATGESHFTITDIDLYEISVCTFPAYEGTEVTARCKQVEEHKKRHLDAAKNKLRKRLKNIGISTH